MQKPIRIDPQTSLFLDSVRGFSAIIVLLSHITQIFILPYFGLKSPLDDISNLIASYAVMSFFIISGFVIATSIMANIQKNAGKFGVKNFLVGRLTRLVPPLIFALLLTIGVFACIHYFNLHGNQTYQLPGDLFVIRDKASLDLKAILSSLVFIQDIVPGIYAPSMNGALWSLSYEFWFYILAMLFVNWLVNKRFYLGGFLLMVLVVCLVYLKTFLFFTFLITWCGGAGWAILYHWRKDLYEQVKLIALPVLFGVSAVLVIESSIGVYALNNPYRSLQYALLQSCVCLVGVVICMQITSRLETSKFSFLGFHKAARFSYTLYVIHFPLLMLVFSLLHPVLHPLPVIYTLLVGIILGVVIILLSSWLAPWVENKNSLRMFFKLR